MSMLFPGGLYRVTRTAASKRQRKGSAKKKGRVGPAHAGKEVQKNDVAESRRINQELVGIMLKSGASSERLLKKK